MAGEITERGRVGKPINLLAEVKNGSYSSATMPGDGAVADGSFQDDPGQYSGYGADTSATSSSGSAAVGGPGDIVVVADRHSHQVLRAMDSYQWGRYYAQYGGEKYYDAGALWALGLPHASGEGMLNPAGFGTNSTLTQLIGPSFAERYGLDRSSFGYDVPGGRSYPSLAAAMNDGQAFLTAGPSAFDRARAYEQARTAAYLNSDSESPIIDFAGAQYLNGGSPSQIAAGGQLNGELSAMVGAAYVSGAGGEPMLPGYQAEITRPLAGRLTLTGDPIAAETAVPQVTANRLAGNAFRDEIAGLLKAEGRDVTTEVYKSTPFGKRFIDIEVSKDGQVLGGIETKFGGSRYTPAQRAKDWWLKANDGYIVNVVRDK